MITVLSGGTGTPKLLQGLKEIIEPEELTIIVNTLENDYFSGVYVSADIDTVLYTLSDLINEKLWYGQKNDTFHTHNALKKLGYNELLQIGDKDRALKIQKTMLLKQYTLEQSVKIQKDALGIKSTILPMSNMQSEVKIYTENGTMSFHDFLIKHKSEPEIKDVMYSQVKPTKNVIKALDKSEQIIIGPSNPITSINPILNMSGIRKALKNNYVTSISPIIGQNTFSGPASKFMKAKNYEVSCIGVANLYEEFLDHFIIDNKDEKYQNKLEQNIPKVSCKNILLKTMQDKLDLSKYIINN